MIQNIDRNSQGEQNRYLLKIFIFPEKEKKINGNYQYNFIVITVSSH